MCADLGSCRNLLDSRPARHRRCRRADRANRVSPRSPNPRVGARSAGSGRWPGRGYCPADNRYFPANSRACPRHCGDRYPDAHKHGIRQCAHWDIERSSCSYDRRARANSCPARHAGSSLRRPP